ncbi:MAG: UxaA family hydrolase [Firmicutes bacterium]|nr:UxaA family hydrolase [Bacillota bacterium]
MADGARQLMGYRRPVGRHGLRNHLAVIPASVCACEVAQRIASQVPGSVALSHPNGCCQMGEDYAQTARTLVGMGMNANVGACLVVGLGCEGMDPVQIVDGIRSSGKPVELVVIQKSGGTTGAVRGGLAKAEALAAGLAQMQPEPFDISELVLGLECGASDPTSGIGANPSLGVASDMLIASGGTSILSETTELIGAEHLLAERAVDARTAEALIGIVAATERRAKAMGADLRGTQPTPGNIRGGISTIEEKSLGCILKAGRSPLIGVLKYGEPVTYGKNGLYMMDTPGQDVDSMTGMLAGGAQIVVFTTGLGTPTGTPIAPVIKVTANAATYRMMQEDTDLDLSPVMDGSIGLREAGETIFDEILSVSRGKLTKSELNGHREFGIMRVGWSF